MRSVRTAGALVGGSWRQRLAASCVGGALVLGGLVVRVPHAEAALTGGPDVIPAPASVLESATANPPGATNNHQQAFDERQGIRLTEPLGVDGGTIPAGTVVDSHMIFMNLADRTKETVVDSSRTWTFQRPVLGVMSDRDGRLETQSSSILGAPGTAYPQAPLQMRGMDLPPGHKWRGAGGVNGGYVIKGSSIAVGMTVLQPGDWIRVVTEGRIPPAATTLTADSATVSTALNLSPVGATLTSNGAPVEGQTIAFTASDGTPICTAVTDAGGKASCTSASPLSTGLQVLLSGYTATFAGADPYLPSTGHGPIELLPSPSPSPPRSKPTPSPTSPPTPPISLPSPSPTPSPSPSPSPPAPSPSPSPTISVGPSPSPTATVGPSPTPSESPVPVPSATPTPSESPTVLGTKLPRTGSGAGKGLVVGLLLVGLGAILLGASGVRGVRVKKASRC